MNAQRQKQGDDDEHFTISFYGKGKKWLVSLKADIPWSGWLMLGSALAGAATCVWRVAKILLENQ